MASDEVRELLQSRKAALDALAERLFEKETIDGAEVRTMIESHYPGPKLVPGTQAITAHVKPVAIPVAAEETRRAEDAGTR